MRNGKTVAAFIAVLLASFTVMSVMSSGDLPQAFMQETVLALVALAGVGFAEPNALNVVQIAYNIETGCDSYRWHCWPLALLAVLSRLPPGTFQALAQSAAPRLP